MHQTVAWSLCRWFQYSCHGLVWFSAVLAMCWMIDNPKYYQLQMNLLLGLILDVFIVASIKAATRRRRPTIDDNEYLSINPDKFSFPSGHASRAFLILVFFTALEPLPIFFWPPMFAWAISVSLSRLLAYRHHILDVLGGIVLGILESFLLCILWLGKDSSKWVMSWLSDEQLPTGTTQEDLFWIPINLSIYFFHQRKHANSMHQTVAIKSRGLFDVCLFERKLCIFYKITQISHTNTNIFNE